MVSQVTSTEWYCEHTVNGESFTGLKFHGIHIIWIFPVIFLQCKARALNAVLSAKDSWEKLSHCSKNCENHKILAQ